MKIHLQLLLLLSIILYIVCACVQQPTCGECAGYAACYWCQSSGKCEEYYGEKFANLLCPNKWVQHQSLCSASSGNTKMDQILDILKHVNNYQNPQTSSGSSSSSSLAQQGNILPIKSMAERKKDGESSEELKELLHKLLLLKILRKLKSEGSSSLSAEDRQMLSQLTNANLGPVSTRTTTTTTTATKSPNGDMNNELKQLLSILKSQSAEGQTHSVVSKQPPRTKVKTTGVTSSVHAANHSSVGSQDKSKHISEGKVNSSESVMSLLKKIDEQNAGVVYEEHKTDVIVKPVKSSANTSQPMRPSKNESVVVGKEPTATSSATLNYCSLYQEIDLCNSDRNCTWCNTRDLCIQRSGDDYKSCVAAKDQMMDTEYGLDKCLALKHCKQCVENNKCYWCDVSKSCHTYPFIGYVPQTCGGDWYVKQCDVQLAVIIIVLPLIIILLAMVTFYFCLKYCYYRRKVLRVPLFEKPGVFDYRKDKKVYYVNPEDESSDTEMAAEKIRKKYRLPVEREPLIDPNS